jgi:hypothetical protein
VCLVVFKLWIRPWYLELTNVPTTKQRQASPPGFLSVLTVSFTLLMSLATLEPLLDMDPWKLAVELNFGSLSCSTGLGPLLSIHPIRADCSPDIFHHFRTLT